MSNHSKDTARLLDAQSVEAEIIDPEYSTQPSAPPPSYEIATAGSSYNQDPIGFQVPVSSQPSSTQYYGYHYLHPAGGQSIPGSAPGVLNGQPIFVIPVTTQPTASGQPLVVHHYENYGNTREPGAESSSDSDKEGCSCEDCCIACLCCLQMTRCCIECMTLFAECSK